MNSTIHPERRCTSCNEFGANQLCNLCERRSNINPLHEIILNIYINTIQSELIFNTYTDNNTYYAVFNNVKLIDMRVLCISFGFMEMMPILDFVMQLDVCFKELAWTSHIQLNINELMRQKDIYMLECNSRSTRLNQLLQESNFNLTSPFINLEEYTLLLTRVQTNMQTSLNEITSILGNISEVQSNNRYVIKKKNLERQLEIYIRNARYGTINVHESRSIPRSRPRPSHTIYNAIGQILDSDMYVMLSRRLFVDEDEDTPLTPIVVTHTKTYLKEMVIEMVENNINTDPCDCTICFDAFSPCNIIHTNCNHALCIDCISGYSESIKDNTRKPTCPTCRTEFVKLNTYDTLTTTQLTQMIQQL